MGSHGRRRQFEAWCKEKGYDAAHDVNAGIAYAMLELLGGRKDADGTVLIENYKAVADQVRQARTRDEAVDIIGIHYEGPADYQSSRQARINGAIRAQNVRLALEQEKASMAGPATPAPGIPAAPAASTAPSATGAQLMGAELAAEALANQALLKLVPGVAPIVQMIENTVINPFLPSVNAALGKNIDSNQAAHAVFVVGLTVLGMAVKYFVPSAQQPRA
jgi:hypothetical protein